MEKMYFDLPSGKLLLGSMPQGIDLRETEVIGGRPAEVLDACGVEIISVEETSDDTLDPLAEC